MRPRADRGVPGGGADGPRPRGGPAHDPLTYRSDAIVFEKALLGEPDNSRYVFYLAQSYRDAKEPELALRQYRRRTTMGGWRSGLVFALSNRPPRGAVEQALARGDGVVPGRVPVPAGSRRAPLSDRHALSADQGVSHGEGFLRMGDAGPAPGPTGLFVERAMYDYLLDLEHAVCCYYTGAHAQAIAINERLLTRGTLPDPLADQVRKNPQFSLDALGECQPGQQEQ